MIALGLDTSCATGSMGLFDDAGRIAPRSVPSPPVHSRRLLDTLGRALREAGARIKDLGVVAVACGPGSFTGLRVGMATARGLGLAIGCPVVGFSTLETMAIAGAPPGGSRVTVLMDAGRGQVYRGQYSVAAGAAAAGGPASLLLPEAAVAIGEALREAAGGIVVCGEGLAESIILGARLRELGAIAAPPIGLALARRGVALCRRGAGGVLPPLIPNYLRASDAETTAAP
jgi:tRNA threonylcarbamoyladenosine biosynthesis protein TsaB